MQVVFIENGYSSKMSGGDVHAHQLANYLAVRGWEVHTVLPKGVFSNEYNAQIRLHSYQRFPFEEKIYKNTVVLFILYIFRIFLSIRILRNLKILKVVAISHLFHDVVPLLFCGQEDCFVFVHHLIQEQDRKGLRGAITCFLEKISLSIIHQKNVKIITVSPQVTKQLCEVYRFKVDNIYQSTNAINATKGDAQVIVSDYDLVFCGRLHRTKGIFDIVDILQKLKKDIPEIRCAIIGTGSDAVAFKELVKTEGLESNIFGLGFLSEEDKERVLRSSKVFFLPSHEEGWGIVIGEALALGLPAVVYKLPELEPVWKDAVSWVPCFDTVAYAALLKKMLSDTVMRKRNSEYGMKYVKSFSSERVFTGESDFLNNTL